MKRLFLTLALVAMAMVAMAQGVSVKPYGFVRNYLTFDNRSMFTVCGGDYNNLPLDENYSLPMPDRIILDEVDKNDISQIQFHALSTRFGLKLNGPDVLGAKSTGRIEADFAGFSSTNTVLRLRLAWVDLNWGGRHALRVGQDWHPLSGEIMPDALGFAAGAPFRPHSRTPQFRYTYSTPWGFGVQAHLLYQYQFISNGPDGANEKYANRALVPEMFFGLNFKSEHMYAQIGADVLTLRPRAKATAKDSEVGDYNIDVDELFTSVSPTIYFQYVDGLFSVKCRSTYAQNTTHVNQMSGYAVTGVDGYEYEYSPMRATISYLNFAYGKKYKVNLFFGYMKNFGTADDMHLFKDGFKMYLKSDAIKNLDYMWRIAPSVSYNLPHFNVGLEYELTSVGYGDMGKMKANGTFESDDVHAVNGSRICLLVKYNF